MHGTNTTNGKPLAGIAHLKQSIKDILTTPIGSRIMRRDYGSRLFELVDRPMDGALTVDLYSATAEALYRWEPRFKLNRVQVEKAEVGKIELILSGQYLPENRTITLQDIFL